jgi:hypothetical protein
MSKPTLKYNDKSAHFIVPHGGTPKQNSPSPLTGYIGTVVFRKNGSDVNAGKLDVYYINDWKGSGIKKYADGIEFFMNALKSPDNFSMPIYDTDAVRAFAENDYYFVDEKTGQKSLRCFNIRWQINKINAFYRGCAYFRSDVGFDGEAVYDENEIPTCLRHF